MGDVHVTSMSPAMAGDHAGVLTVLPLVPVAIVAVLLAVELAARAGVGPATRFQRAWRCTAPAVQLAALGMVISAAVHLRLVTAHLAEDPVLGVLFALDGVALLVAAVWSLTRPVPGWRVGGVVLLMAGVMAYVGYVVAGAETADAAGIATKLVELAAAALLCLPDRLTRRALAGRPVIRHSANGGPNR